MFYPSIRPPTLFISQRVVWSVDVFTWESQTVVFAAGSTELTVNRSHQGPADFSLFSEEAGLATISEF